MNEKNWGFSFTNDNQSNNSAKATVQLQKFKNCIYLRDLFQRRFLEPLQRLKTTCPLNIQLETNLDRGP